MELPGSQQLGWGKKFLEQFDWTHFEPREDWVSWADAEGQRNWGAWIWYPEGDPKHAAPVEARYFRRAFDLPANEQIKRARLTVAADDRFQAWVNGTQIGAGENWSAPRDFDVKALFGGGQNLLAIRAENAPAPVKDNPAGLMAMLEIELKSGKKLSVRSDDSWRVSKTDAAGWIQKKFDDSNWAKALVTAQYGEGPWGRIGGDWSSVVPFAAGISNRLLVVYGPDARGIGVSHLQPTRKYELTQFDPVTGERAKPSPSQSDSEGNLVIPSPSHSHDWLVTLELER
jgi:hypothetical protein